jgi:formate dehydrogenase major subunit
MTNHYIDLKNSDCILIMGSNAAENHPIAFKWILRAKERGAKIIHVDPRYTRTSARCDYHVPLRSGTDIAFLGGMIKYILDKDLIQDEYVKNYTNASQIVSPGFNFEDGLFSGYNAEKRLYSSETWTTEKDPQGIPVRDLTLQNPRCVYQMLKKHYERYTLEMVSSITGVSKENLEKVYAEYGATGARDKAGTECYALGWTHHTTGSQIIRTMSIIQLLLGNMGICGGGINALRGEPNVQGSTDHCILYNLLPGYLKLPSASIDNINKYLEKYTPKSADPQSVNWYQNYPKYMISFLKAMYGDAAVSENSFGYDWLPKMDDGTHYSLMHIFDRMYQGKIKGLFSIGTNPAVSSPNTTKIRKGLEKLEWMVSVNIFNNETASFWKGPGVDSAKIQTECFLLPAAATVEKDGSQTNSGRWAQWKYKAANPPGDALPDGEITLRIMDAVRDLYKKEGGSLPESILNLKWDYRDVFGRFDATKTARQINGTYTRDVVIEDAAKGTKEEHKKGEPVVSFGNLLADGSTASGNWLMCGSFDAKGENKMMKRGKDDPTGLGLFPEWSYVWPLNRRILYNRASCDLNGKPYNPKMKLLEWTGEKWVGDVPDGPAPPLSDKEKGKYPFIMKPDGLGAIFGPGMVEGPFPEHYEPLEGPLTKNPFSGQLQNPVITIFKSDLDKVANADPQFPVVCTTYSCTEHWCSGALTRWQPWLLEMQPQAYAEIGEKLAGELGIKNGQKIKISSIRGSVKCIAMVTKRFQPFQVEGKTVHQIGMPYNYGWLYPEGGADDATNHLTPTVGCPNTFCPEYKAFMVNVSKA